VPTVPLVALKPHRYDGRLVRKGERYAAHSESDALVLTTIGYSTAAQPSARPDPPPPPPLPVVAPEPEPEPAAPAADDVQEDSPVPSADVTADAPRSRRYRRKDMAAEE
jgi:hypothetical protein